MNRFLNKLIRGIRKPSKTRRSGPPSRRAVLNVDGLEDRVVLSSATLVGSTLDINVTANTDVIISELNPTGNRQIQVSGINNAAPAFPINSIKAVNITVQGENTVIIDDSNGMPFATGSTITFNGGGSNNLLVMEGSRAIDTGEDYLVSTTPTSPSAILLDGLNFQVGSAIGTVEDTLQITGGPDFVATSGQNVVSSTPSSFLSELSGLGPGGGGTLLYANKPTVQLNEFAADATVNLDTTLPANREQQFTVVTRASGDSVVIASTPSSISTSVQVTGSGSQVVLKDNSGNVSISGNSSSSLLVGQQLGNGTDTTKGIQADVEVSNMGLLLVSDNGNVTTQENVTVTQSAISGTGFLGNNAAEIFYSNVPTISIISGQLTDSYTVKGSTPTAEFTSQINIFDDSSKFFGAHVDVNANSHLDLALFNSTTKPGELFINATGGKFSNSPGVVDMSFNGVLSSRINEQGFIIEEEHS